MGIRTTLTMSALAAAATLAAAGDTVDHRILMADTTRALFLDESTVVPTRQREFVAQHFDLQPGDREVLDVVMKDGDYPRVWTSRPSMALGKFMIAKPVGQNPNAERAFGAPAKAEAEARVGRLIDKRFDQVGELRLRLPEGMDPSAFTHFLMATGDYEYVEPDWIVSRADTIPNDPLFASSYHHARIQSALAWDLFTGTNNVTVAVCDTGVDNDHLDLALSLVSGFNAVTNLTQAQGGVTDDNTDAFGHGTFVAGMAAARGNNNRDVVGAGWNFRIMPVKVSNSNDGTAPNSDIQQGAQWAATNGARIVNVSYSGVTSSSVQNTGAFLKSRNALLFYSAGNDSAQLPSFEWNDVVVVAATNSSDTRAGFSNFGGMVSLTAPGESVRSTRRGGGTTISSGTSFSSPLAAGVAALCMSANPVLTADEVQDILYATVDDLGTPGEDDLYGRGRVNSFRALALALGSDELLLPLEDSFEGGTLDPVTWVIDDNVSVVTPPVPAPDGTSALRFAPNGIIETDELRGGSLDTTGGRVSFQLLERGVEPGQAITVEYLDENSVWQVLASVPSFSVLGRTGWVRYDFSLPEASLRTGLKVRVSTPPGNPGSNPEWFVDSLAIEGDDEIAPPMLEPVIVDALADSRFFQDTAGASVSTAADGEPSGDHSIAYTGPANLVTVPFDSNAAFEAATLVRFAWQTRGVPPGNRLRLELFDFNGPSVIGEVTTAGDDDFQIAEFTGWPFTPSFFGSNTITFTLPDGNAGTWYLDEVQLGGPYQPIEFPAGNPGCNVADVAPEFGQLNVNDVIDFVNGFNTANPVADVSPPGGDGAFNVNDVIDFVNAFNVGCP